MTDIQDKITQYDLLISKLGVERKGKTSPYTSVGGNMYTMLRKDGVLGIRLSKEDRDKFMADYDASAFENYGAKIKEYVEIPESVFYDTDLMVKLLKKSLDYTKTLKKKATKKVVKKSKEVSLTYKNGQVKSEVKGDLMIHYFQDGSLKSKGKYLDDKKEGKWIFYRKSGQILEVAHYKSDLKDGEFIRYDSKDKIAYHVIFKAGKVVEKIY
ncbi:toxin-antitoxin system YwqK family antitoxin [Acidaminobacter sp. JC074]|uniref:toxin-antitoxin system YwqK family antitoxin n=1 Tax=Acidaminobacter sp. JC074 TaxID=2530199 RepID=UPI001F0D05DA|nr:hypothetical protein [Acidaminobacter sp. JC074]